MATEAKQRAVTGMIGISPQCTTSDHLNCGDEGCRCRCHYSAKELSRDRVQVHPADIQTPPGGHAEQAGEFPPLCPKCGAKGKAGDKFCRKDGAALKEQEIFCAGCGENNAPTDMFCGGCGNPLGES